MNSLRVHLFDHTVNYLLDGHLWDPHPESVLEICPSYRESTKRSKERQEPTLGVHLVRSPSHRSVHLAIES